MAAAQDLKSQVERREGSNPFSRTIDQWCNGNILVSKTKDCGSSPCWSVLIIFG